MSDAIPAVGETLELLERLRGAARECAAAEETVEQEFGARIGGERQRRDSALDGQNQRQADAIAAADAALESGRAAIEARHARRRAQITRARNSSKELAQKRIEDHTGSRKYELQKWRMQTDRNRVEGLAAANAALAQFTADIGAEQGRLLELERKARAAFGGYGGFSKPLNTESEATQSVAGEQAALADLRAQLDKADAALGRFGKLPLPLIFRFLPLWLLLALCLVPGGLAYFKVISLALQPALGISVGAMALFVLLHFAGGKMAAGAAAEITTALLQARQLYGAGLAAAAARQTTEVARVETDYRNNGEFIDQQLKLALKEAADLRGTFRETVDNKTLRVMARGEALHQAKLAQAAATHAAAIGRANQLAEAQILETTRQSAEREEKLRAAHRERWTELETDWKKNTRAIYDAINAINASAAKIFPEWLPPRWEKWSAPRALVPAAQFARLEVDLEKSCERLPRDPRLALPGPARFSLPLHLAYPQSGSILLETAAAGHDEAIAALNNVMLRLLSVAPPGRMNFTILDPVGLGQNFAGIMHLADYETQLINNRIWTQTAQIEQRLADLNEHMEKVIQMYLRNEYATIAEYNEAAGNIAEKYHLLVVADFPAGFSDLAARRLMSIAASGARCGVFTLFHWDTRGLAPTDFSAEEFRKTSVCLTARTGDFMLARGQAPGTRLILDPPPAPEFAINFIHKVGKASKDSSRVEVPFSQVAPPAAEMWTVETAGELRVPIGRTGATKLQYLAIGKGTRQHALIAGKTGSGKSTLFHIIITNLALWCSPEQVEFYLVDFKKGVEFKCYGARRLPHARVVAIESDREFGLSVLQRVDEELRRRGEMFRQLGAQDISGYQRLGGKEPVPRSLLLIDEFQEFFTEDDKISQTASVLLDRIVRQGRAFGIHVILGSQTLGGAYTVARTTLGQMVIRIALQCNEADSYLIMDENNAAPRLLSRPGEGIYNDAAGALEGNSPFQAVWLSDEIRDRYLDQVIARAAQSGVNYPGPLVFEGDAPAEVAENPLLAELLAAEKLAPTAAPRIWLGAPNSIKGPTEVVFHKQSGNNLLFVGQREEAVLSMLSLALISLSAQHAPGTVRFVVFDATPPGMPQREFLERVIRAIPHPVKLARPGDAGAVMRGLAADLNAMAADAEHPGHRQNTFLLFNGLQKINELRYEEDFGFSSGETENANPAMLLNQIICEGTRQGFHVLASCDTYNNVNRFLSRKALSEFELRVLFQMSANDSASLIDSPKGGSLGLHRALYYNQQEGSLEVFRPYAPPGTGWVEAAAANLARLIPGNQK